jgi:predicted glycosyltransferase
MFDATLASSTLKANETLVGHARPTLLFYCQHSLGIGHLTRSFALATAMAEFFHVVFLNGGRLPPGLPFPKNIELIDLPALGMDDGHTVVSRDATHDVAQAQAQRRALIDAAVRAHHPAVVLVELFPFGRKKFANEILPLIRMARNQAGLRARIVCSLRDILVDARRDQQHHDDRARWLADRYFDAVLVHADPSFARIEDSFHPRKPMQVPVHYTGYVVPARAKVVAEPRGEHLLVSAGGGIVGDDLFRVALQARELMRKPLPMRIIAGPFLPEAHWLALQRIAAGVAGVELLRQVPDMAAEMRHARASISQCGYNTALDIVVAGVPALVVPYQTPGENEQIERATRLAALGAMQYLSVADLNAPMLAAKIEALLTFQPTPSALDLHGAQRSASTLRQMHIAANSLLSAGSQP